MSFLLNVFASEHNLSSSLSCEQLTEGVSENYPKLLGPLGDLLGLHHVQVTDLFHLLALSHEVHWAKNIRSSKRSEMLTAVHISPLVYFFFAAAWVDPGRNALQSAEQGC